MDGDALIAITGTIAVFAIPIIAILTAHQRKMAEIIHGSQRQQMAVNNDVVASEIRDLKQAVNQQTIALDSLATEIRRTLPSAQSEPLTTRLRQEP